MSASAPDSGRFSHADIMVIAASAISMLIIQMDWFALNLALPVIARDFDVPATDLQWVISGYMLAIGALMVTAGRLADMYGRRRLILIGLGVFGVMSAVCGSALDEDWLIAARIVQGVGAALVFPVAIAVVSSTFSGARQNRAIGIVLAFSAVGTALGPFIGGVFAEHVTWRAVFFVNVPFCIAAAILVMRYVRESRDETADERIDVAGVLTVSGGLIAIAYAIDMGQDWGWSSAKTLGLIAAGIVLLVAFVVVERRVREPLVDLALFRNKAFVAVTLAGSLSNVVYCFVAVYSGFYLQEARGLSPLDSGLIFLALSAGAGLASYYGGRLADRYPPERLMAGGMLISAVGIAALTSVTSLWVYTPLFFVCGVGVGLGWALANVATQAVVPAEVAGVASGVVLTALVMLAAVGVAVGTAILDVLAGSAATASADVSALDTVLRAGAVLALLGAVTLVVLGRRPRSSEATAPGYETASKSV